MKCLFYTMGDGRVIMARICREDGSYSSGIQRKIAEARARQLSVEEAAQAALSAVALKSMPLGAVSWRVGESTELPGGKADGTFDATFYHALEHQGGVLGVNLSRARDVHRDKIRAARAPLFEPLERAQRTALAVGNAAEAMRLESKLQELRDAPADPAIDAAATVGELKAVWPACLTAASAS